MRHGRVTILVNRVNDFPRSGMHVCIRVIAIVARVITVAIRVNDRVTLADEIAMREMRGDGILGYGDRVVVEWIIWW